MVETRAVVTSLLGDDVVVEIIQGTGCGNCHTENGCGTGNLSKFLSRKPRRFRVHNDVNAQVGSIVQVVMMDGSLLRSSLLMYILPLILLLAGSTLGEQWSSTVEGKDVASAIFGLIGVFLGFVFVRLFLSGKSPFTVMKPVILPISVTKLDFKSTIN